MKRSFPGGFLLKQRIGLRGGFIVRQRNSLPGGIDMTQQGFISNLGPLSGRISSPTCSPWGYSAPSSEESRKTVHYRPHISLTWNVAGTSSMGSRKPCPVW